MPARLRANALIVALSAAVALVVAAFEDARILLILGLGFLGGDASIRSALFLAASPGAVWFAWTVAFVACVAVGYVVFAAVRLLKRET